MHKNILLFIAGLFGLSVAIFAEEDQFGYVKGTGVVLRASHAAYYESLAKLPENTPLEIVSRQGDWVEVRLPVRITGWVQKDRIDENGAVKDALCPIYTAPGLYFTAFHTASQGESLALEGSADGDWLCVYAPEDATGWIHADYVEAGLPRPPAPPQTDEVVDAAAGLESAALAARTQAIRQEQERQEQEMQQEQQRLANLVQQAEKLKEETTRHNDELVALQNEAQRLEALRNEAQEKARKAAADREEMLLKEKRDQEELLARQKAAEEQARLVEADSARWEAEAKAMAEKLAAAKAEAKLREEAAQKEAAAMEAEQTAAEQRAKEALEQVKVAEAQREESARRQEELARQVAALQQEVKNAGEQAELLKLERERIEATAREETARLAQARQEAERLQAEKDEQAAKIEAVRIEAEKLQAELLSKDAELKTLRNQALEREKNLAELEQLKQASAEAAGTDAELARQIAELKVQVEQRKAEAEAKAAELQALKQAEAEANVTEEAKKEEPPQNTNVAEETPPAPAEPSAPDLPAGQAKATPQPAKPQLTRLKGTLLPLQRATPEATHALYVLKDGKQVALCYLVSKRLNLNEWRNTNVEVAGTTTTLQGWTRPILQVRSIVKIK